jgi:predicted ATPase/DNA-binding winged helix-turn-helix (wHTH) protein
MESEEVRTAAVVSFGPFTLSKLRRRLEFRGRPVPIGGRAFDTLVALLERPGEIVGKRDLLRQAWPDASVDEGSLRFQIAALRKIFRRLDPGSSYIANAAGRGYRFVARVLPSPETDARARGASTSETDQYGLPPLLARMVGRDEAVLAITRQLAKRRFVTIVGPGGIGKTTVAVAVAHSARVSDQRQVYFVDLAPATDPRLAPALLATTLGIPVVTGDPLPGLLAYLRDEKALVILDSCEHVTGSVAPLAEHLHREAPKLHLLATSREALNVTGEHVHHLSALACPAEGPELQAAEAMNFPAVRLFVDRAEAISGHFQLHDENSPIVADICRRLDGIPLAIEMAASLLTTLGVSDLRSLLRDRLASLSSGRRTTIKRHRTLSAVLDWSFDTLSDIERAVLRHLAIIVGTFDFEAMIAIADDGRWERHRLTDAFANLVAKSLVSTIIEPSATRYRLLEMTRAHATAGLAGGEQLRRLSLRHAVYYRGLVDGVNAAATSLKYRELVAHYHKHLGNIRIALDWSFSPEGDAGLAVRLAVSAAQMFYGLSLFSECLTWTERALALLDEESRGGSLELELQLALAESRAFTVGNDETVGAAIERGREISLRLGGQVDQMRISSHLFIVTLLGGGFREALPIAKRTWEIAQTSANPDALAIAGWMLGMSNFYLGNQAEAQTLLEAAVIRAPKPSERNVIWLTVDLRLRILCSLMWCLWLRGQPDSAIRMAMLAMEEAQALDHGFTLCSVYVAAEQVFLWVGDLSFAGEICDRLATHARKYSLVFHSSLAVVLKAELSARSPKPREALEALEYALQIEERQNSARGAKFRWLRHKLPCSLAEGLASIGEVEKASAVAEDAISAAESIGFLWTMPELLRVRGQLLALIDRSDTAHAASCILASAELARQQSALSWELQAATGLARLYLEEERLDEALGVLEPIYARFREGFDTSDLIKAKQLLERLRALLARTPTFR